MEKALPKVIAIVGPTASGKTDLAIQLAKKWNGEIINADSRQIYREMDIATGKPSVKRQASSVKCFVDGVRHHLFDIADPDEIISVALWKKKAVRAVRDILKRKKVPIVVGGTGLYIRALVENLAIPQVPPNLTLRETLEREIRQKGLPAVYQKLIALDPEAIHVVSPTNPRRVIRAIEVCTATHQPFTVQRKKGKPLFEFLVLGISVPREKLYERIDKRIDRQFEEGLIEETEKLMKLYDARLPAMTGIGYKEAGEYLQGALSLMEAKSRMKFRTHDYARRQITWFRKNPYVRWIETRVEAHKTVKKFLKEKKTA